MKAIHIVTASIVILSYIIIISMGYFMKQSIDDMNAKVEYLYEFISEVDMAYVEDY